MKPLGRRCLGWEYVTIVIKIGTVGCFYRRLLDSAAELSFLLKIRILVVIFVFTFASTLRSRCCL